MNKLINKSFEDHIALANTCKSELGSTIKSVADCCYNAILSGHKIILFGNGGSAADAQHIAAEFTGRFVKERRGLPAIALTTDTSALTAIGNDYGYDRVFERQVEALANPGDILLGISTSGNSENVVKALSKGQNIGCEIIGLSGRDGGKMNSFCNYNLVVPSDVTARIQEMHILIGHLICEIVDENF